VNFGFLAPWRLLLLVLVAGLAGAYVLLQQRKRHYAVRFTNVGLLAEIAPRRPGWRRHVAAAAMLASLAVLVLSFAKPTRLEQVPREQATVVLAIDTSASMQATDVAPTRLAAAQQAATSFANQLPPGFRLGLVAFNGTARVVVTPTTDHQQVADAINGLQLGQSTAAGEAVYTSLDVIRASITAATAKDAARIVLMSDGATTVGRPVLQAATAAADAGVPVSTIAFGTDTGVVAIGNRLIPVPVDRQAMQDLASTSGGSFFEATTGEELGAVYKDIRSAIGYTTERREATAWMAGIALLFAFTGVGAGLVWSGRVL
jgi:Ca-activated chloride channel family protein